jgi:alkyldihydroxyacetonephosphate synthase
MLFADFASGVAAVRAMRRAGLPLSMARLSDGAETELQLLLRRDPARRIDPTAWALDLAARAGWGRGRCALLYGADSDEPRAVRRTLRRARSIGREHGGLPLGAGPGRSWRRERFRTPYLRDWLLDRGVAVDTMETAFSWSRLERGHQEVMAAMRDSLASRAGAGLCMAHLSHSYRDGACLYFTALWPLDEDRALDQWAAIKRAVTDAIVAAGGTLSHHHGVGIDHVAWLAREKGTLALAALRGAKAALDPRGLMNPGKLL